MRRLVAATVLAALLSAACSSASSSDGAVSSSTTSTSTSSTTSTTEATPTEDSPADVWVDLWAAATAEGSTAADLETFATPEVAAQVMTIATIEERNRRQVLNSPNSDPSQTVGESTVEDCAFLTPPQAETAANFFRGTGAVDDTGVFRFHTFEVVSRTGCIPAELNEAVLRDYADYWARSAVSNGSPPLLDTIREIATGEHLSSSLALLQQLERDGQYLREEPVIHPEVIEWRSRETIVVLDCQGLDPESGIFDEVTGERTPNSFRVQPGDRGLREVTMQFEDGRWKVADRQGNAGVECEFAPTPRGVPVV